MPSGLRLKCLVLLILFLSHLAFGFDFSYTPPTSCDNLTISWSGGSGPFFLLITPPFDVPQNISIPDSAIDSSLRNGSFSVQLALSPGRQFLLTMSDSTGFESGGTSNLLTVGSSVSGSSCNTTAPNPDFFFQLNSALQQCRHSRTFTFSGYDNAIQPVRILGLIPLGQSFELVPPSGSTRFDWIADVSQGTSIVFIMTDSEGRQGGSSDLRIVGVTDDDSCISASSPHSTAQASATQTGVAKATETIQASTDSRTAAITGATVGGVALVSLALLVSFFCFHRQRRSKNVDPTSQGPGIAFIGSRSSRLSRVRESLMSSGSRVRRAHPSFDLLPPSALHSTSHGNSPLHQSIVPPSENEYIPSPYVLPSEDGAIDGHSAHHSSSAHPRVPPPPIPRSRVAFSDRRSHTRSHSRSDAGGQLSPASAYLSSLGHTIRPSVPDSTFSVTTNTGTPGKASFSDVTRTTPRFVLHTDAEDLGSSDEGDEVIELPPQYSDRRDSNARLNGIKGPDQVSG